MIYQFFTNLVFEDDDNYETLSTLVKGTEIDLTLKSLGKILHFSYTGLNLHDINMDDEVLSRIYLPNQGPPRANNKLQPIPRLIDRIPAYNSCAKMGSFNYYSCDLASCVYAIMAKLEVNWAQIIFDTLVKEHSSSLPYRPYLTFIFKKFKLDLASETNVVKVFKPFDRSILLRMKLIDTPP